MIAEGLGTAADSQGVGESSLRARPIDIPEAGSLVVTSEDFLVNASTSERVSVRTDTRARRTIPTP
jgi:hypothetical protein